jgi:uncharacterized protein involved in response to NO
MSQEPMNDKLSNLWRSEASSSSISSQQKEKEGEEMLTMVIERTRKFDRRILLRNVREIVGAFIVTAVFAWFGWKAPSGLEKIGDAIVAASGVWIAYYIVRFGGGPKALDRGLNLNAYGQLLRENYEQQTRLARTVKYWYLLPMYAGLLVANLGFWLRMHGTGQSARPALVSMAIVTVAFGFVWILNEVYSVRCLEKLKRELKGME